MGLNAILPGAECTIALGSVQYCLGLYALMHGAACTTAWGCMHYIMIGRGQEPKVTPPPPPSPPSPLTSPLAYCNCQSQKQHAVWEIDCHQDSGDLTPAVPWSGPDSSAASNTVRWFLEGRIPLPIQWSVYVVQAAVLVKCMLQLRACFAASKAGLMIDRQLAACLPYCCNQQDLFFACKHFAWHA